MGGEKLYEYGVPERMLSLLILSSSVEPGVERDLKSCYLRFCLHVYHIKIRKQEGQEKGNIS